MSVKSIHGYGMIFQCKGPALDPDYNGKMFTVADMKKMVNRFYKRKNVMKLNENHKGARAEVGVVHNMWIADDNRLMVHVELVSRNTHSRLRIKELLANEMVGLSLETSGQEVLLPNGMKQITNKRLTGVATTNKPDHENTYIVFADPDLDKVLVHAFQDSHGTDAKTAPQPMLVNPRFEQRITEAFQRVRPEVPETEENTNETNPDPADSTTGTAAADDKALGDDQNQKEEEEEEEEEQASKTPETPHGEEEQEGKSGESPGNEMGEDQEEEQEAKSKELRKDEKQAEKSLDPMEVDPPENSNNTNGADFNDQTSKDKIPESAEFASHSTTAMDQSKDQSASPEDNKPSTDIEKIMKENEALRKQVEENERKRKREEQEQSERAKKQRTGEDSYRMTPEDKKTEINEVQRLFNEYLQLQGIHQGGSEEDMKKFLAETLRKKSLKAKESLQAMAELIDADLANLGGDLTEEERENIKRVAMDTSNPDAAAAMQNYISVAHRNLRSHRVQEEKFQAEQRQAQLKFQQQQQQQQQYQSRAMQSTSVLNNRQSVLPGNGQSSLLSRSMDRFRSVLNPSTSSAGDQMDIDDPTPSRQIPVTGNIGLGHNQAQESHHDQSYQQRMQDFMPVEKRIIPEDSIRGSLGSIIQKFGMDSLRTSPIEMRWDRRRLGHEDTILSKVYHYFEKTIPGNMAATIPGKQLQLDTRAIYDEKRPSF